MVSAQVMAAGGQYAPFCITLKQTSHRDVQGLSAHMLADSNELQLSYLFLYLLWVGGKRALFDGSGGHGVGEDGEVEMGNISFESLEIGVVLEESIELVSPSLSLKQDVFAVTLELFLYLGCYGIGKNSLSGSELDIDKLRSNQLVLMGLLCDQLSL